MANVRITAFDSLDLTQAGIYNKSGTAGNIKARFEMDYPAFADPIDPYGSSDAPLSYEPIEQNYLLIGDPDDVNDLLALIEAKSGKKGTLSGIAGTDTLSCTARMIEVKGTWSAPFKDGDPQWLSITVVFQQTTWWS